MVSIVAVGDGACDCADKQDRTVKPVIMKAHLHLDCVRRGTLAFAVDGKANREWNARFISKSPGTEEMSALRLRGEGDEDRRGR
jgi:hypothetical protein